jgi:hypothetical protein
MPSPFPGVDPFIEGPEWEDFHHHLIEEIHRALVPRVRPRYVVRVERRVYVEHDIDPPHRTIRPDVTLLRDAVRSARGEGSAATATIVETEIAPVECTLAMPEDMSEAYLTIRERETMQVVTVIEVLSPSNKRPGSDGRREYLAKREEVLQSSAHLVELDLLRGGQRMPMLDSLPPGDFYAVVSRARRRPRAEVYAWTLRQPLPPIPIPLAGKDPDVTIDLQSIFNTTYDRAGYDYSLRYDQAPEPTFPDDELAWVQSQLKAGRTA